ncbi:MAG: GNAT family N-acetyltransferase [Kofleriaceae bacterium]
MITRRPITDDDIDYVYALRESAYRTHVERHFGPWLEPQQRGFLADDMAEAPYEIILDDGVMVGSVAVSHHDDHDFVEDIMMNVEHRDRGIGTHVMRELMDAARVRGVPLRLSVLDGNRVRVLYERLGFRVTLVVPPRTKFEWP